MAFVEGQDVGAYRIVRMLGEGGMGAVYEVVHRELGTHLALKTYILADEHSDIFRKRFADEGKLLARLKHPNLVHVIDLNWDEQSQVLYYVMDLVLYKDGESRTLSDLEPGGADEDFIYKWFCELCSVLAYVHGQGIIHRDIKLNNILIAPDKHVVLSDFGISRICDDRLRQDLGSERTMSMVAGGLVVGTRGYMAPEVAAGKPATPAADVYSLGVVFFKLLTGVWYDADLAPRATSAEATNTGNTNATKLLEDFERPWKLVLPAMLAANPAERPTDLSKLPELLAKTTNTSVQTVRRDAPRKHRRTYLLVAASLLFVLAMSAALIFLRPSASFSSDDVLINEAFGIPNSVK